jgi:hypothetical protein
MKKKDVNRSDPRAVPLLRRLVAGLSQRRPGFDPRAVDVGFVVDKVALGQVFLKELRFSPVPCQFHSIGAPLKWKSQKKNHLPTRVAQ